MSDKKHSLLLGKRENCFLEDVFGHLGIHCRNWVIKQVDICIEVKSSG